MKKYLVVYFLLLFTAVLLAQRVTIDPIYPGGSGGLSSLPSYAITNQQSGAWTNSGQLWMGTNVYLRSPVGIAFDIIDSEGGATIFSFDGARELTIGSSVNPVLTINPPIYYPQATAGRALVRSSAGYITNAAGTPDGTKFLRDDNTYAVPALDSAALTNNQTTDVTFGSLLAITGTGGGTGLRVSGRGDISSLYATNFIRQISGVITDATNLVFSWSSTNVQRIAPSNNFAISFSDSPPADQYMVYKVIVVLTNGQTSAILPYPGLNGATVSLQSSPSTNELFFISDGTRQWSASGAIAYNTNQFASDGSIKSGALLTNVVNRWNIPPTINGYSWQSIMDAVSVSKNAEANEFGRFAFNEEFWTMANDTALNHGSELWNQSRTGTYFLTNNAVLGFGVWSVSLRTSNSRYAIYGGNAGTFASTRFTNAEVLFLTRVRTSMVDGGGDTNTIRVGFMDAASSESNNGIYFRSTNNVWELVTARNLGRTVSSPSIAPVTANSWANLAWFLDSTGTNIYAFFGTSSTNMSCVATNNATIPHDYFSVPAFYCHRGSTNSTDGLTNSIDYMKLWVRHSY